jgi:ATP-binding cassette subfamily C protein
MLENSTGRYFAYFAGASWLRTAWMVVLLLVAGLVEGIGLAALLPIIEIVISESPDQTSRVSLLVVSGLASIGIPATLLSLLLVIIGAMTLKGILRWFAHRAAGFMTTEVAKELRVDLIEALLRARWQFFVARPAGHVATAVGGEAQRAAMGFQEGCAALAGLIQVAVYAIFAAIISWKVALAAVVAGGLVILLLRRLVSAARSAGRDQTQLMRSLVVHLTDSLTSLKPVKAMARESDLRQLLERDAEKFRDAQRRQISANLSMVAFQEPIMMVFLAIGLYVAIQYSGMPFSTVLLLGFLFFRVAASVNRSQYRYQAMSTGEGN